MSRIFANMRMFQLQRIGIEQQLNQFHHALYRSLDSFLSNDFESSPLDLP